MKFVFSILFLLGTLSAVEAQKEFGTKKVNIPPINSASKTNDKPNTEASTKTNPFALPTSIPSLFDKSAVKPKSKFEIGKKAEINLAAQTDFLNPNAGLVDQLNHKNVDEVSKDFKLIRGNQDLGNFKITSDFVNIRYRDFGEVDGDHIRVSVNDKIVVPLVSLDSFFQGVKIDLQPGFNKIDFEALNQGTVGPNTAEFQVFDDKGRLVASNQWNLATGFKASIMVFKE